MFAFYLCKNLFFVFSYWLVKKPLEKSGGFLFSKQNPKLFPHHFAHFAHFVKFAPFAFFTSFIIIIHFLTVGNPSLPNSLVGLAGTKHGAVPA
jgi:hypothetical protein